MKTATRKKEAAAPIRLDLACGQSKREGFVGIDVVRAPGVDIVHDLESYPWPLRDGSVSEIHCSHYVEHVQLLHKFMDECHRVLVPGGKMFVACPYYTSMRSMQDPFHVRPISEATFLYYNKAWRDANRLDHYPIRADFDFQYGYVMAPDWATRSEEARQFAIRHYFNVVSDIHVTLTKR